MLRFAFALAAVLIASPGVVRAAGSPLDPGGTGGAGGTTGTTTLGMGDFEFVLQRLKDEKRIPADLTKTKDEDWVPLKQMTELPLYLNSTRCACKIPIRVRVNLTQTGAQKLRGNVQRGAATLLAGTTDCIAESPEVRRSANEQGYCREIGGVSEVTNFASRRSQFFVTDIETLFRATRTTTGGGNPCAKVGNVTLLFALDVDRDGKPDASPPLATFTVDGEPPQAPTGVRVQGGNEALTVRWNALQQATDVNGFVVFCSRGRDLVVFEDRPYGDFETPSTLCPTRVPAPTGEVPFTQQLDARYICSDRVSATQTDVRIEGLQNGAPYVVGVAAIDRKGNASPIVQVVQAEPIPTRDFYQGYREAGGEAEGGFCALGRRTTPRAVEVAGGALVALALVLRRARRRRS